MPSPDHPHWFDDGELDPKPQNEIGTWYDINPFLTWVGYTFTSTNTAGWQYYYPTAKYNDPGVGICELTIIEEPDDFEMRLRFMQLCGGQ